MGDTSTLDYGTRWSLLKFKFPFARGTGELIGDLSLLLSEPTLGLQVRALTAERWGHLVKTRSRVVFLLTTDPSFLSSLLVLQGGLVKCKSGTQAVPL